MQPRVIIIACLALAAIPARGDVIHLKNGRTIWADSVRDKGAQVEYDVGDNSYAIPKSLVERVDAGGVPPSYSTSGAAGSELKSGADLQAFTSGASVRGEEDLGGQVIKEGRVDGDALETIAGKSSPEIAAAAYFIAGKHEFEHGDLAKAKRYFDSALGFQPNNSTILNYYAALLVRTGNPAQGLTLAERSVRAAPDSADAYTVLGFAQFSSDRTPDAIRSWKKSLQLRPDSRVEELLAKAERESKTESAFSERESSHFVLRFEGTQTPESFRHDLLSTLEAQYDDLVRELGIAPRGSIAVTLYTNQAFFDVTHAPSWSGALNDGKLRIPISGLSSITPELARVLKHELAHSFVNQASGGRCPMWLHEGVAQYVEPKTLDANGRRLAQLFKVQQQIPFNVLEASFAKFSSSEAVLAYDESLAAVSYISDTYGVSDIQRILDKLSQGSSTEAALRSTIHSDYRDLASEVGKYLHTKYGD